MKFAIAAGILAQTLPALSENEAVDHTIQLGQDLTSTVTRHVKDLRAANRGVQGAPFLQGTNDGKAGLLMNQAGTYKDAAKKKPCNPFSNDPDVGILSCGMGMYCREDESMFLGGECAFLPEKKTHQAASRRLLGRNKIKGMRKPSAALQNSEQASQVVECDPLASIDADVGILQGNPQCEVGYECLPSAASSLGGVCVPEAYLSRMLAEDDLETCFFYVPGQCDPSYPFVAEGYGEIDCAGFDNTTGNGLIRGSFSSYCLGLYRFPGCGDRCLTLSSEVTFANFTVLDFYFCNDFTTPYAHKRCYGVDYQTGTCTYLINGVACDSCELMPGDNYGNYTCPVLKFDCGNVDGGAGVNYPIDGFQYAPIIQSCYDPGPHPNCTMCPEEGTIFDYNAYNVTLEIPGIPPTIGSFMCGGMYYASYLNPYTEGVMEDYCTAISTVTADNCCIPSTEDPTSTEEPDGTAPPGSETPAPSSAISVAAGTFVVATSAALAASAIL